MNSTDQVELIIITPNNCIIGRMTQQAASDIMRYWYESRSKVRDRTEGWEAHDDWLKRGTIAFNGDTDNGVNVATGVVGLENVVGMYSREPPDSVATIHKRIADVMEREQRRGEEWRDPNEVDGA